MKNYMTNNIEAEAIASHIGEIICIHGSIYKIRKMSEFAFVLLRTRSRIVQCTYDPQTADFPLEEIPEESCVALQAEVAAEERSKSGFELHLLSIQVLSRPVEELPIVINQKEINTSLENLLDYRPATLRNEKERAVFRIQAAICQGFRDFLNANSFVEIHTPKIVAEGAEGGANIFRLPYFEKEAYLAQSPQFYKQMMVGVFERVYEIGPVFRAEKHDTSRHLNEYTSIDFEMGYIEGFQDIMQMEEKMLQSALRAVRMSCSYELELLNIRLPDIPQIPRIKFTEAKTLISKTYNRKIRDMEDLEPEEEKLICQYYQEEKGCDFVFITHYPSRKRPFYAMDNPDNPEETLSFDLLFKGMEITTGGQRIHSYDQQIEKMLQKGMDPANFESYLMMHKYGMPPHGGLGIGLERFTGRLLGFENIRHAALFPRDIHRLLP